jgi:uncharacterized protein YyaL (SSP411 family)
MYYFILISLLSSLLFAKEATYTNHLIDEPSPYLQQHAHNPVDWYPWGEEAFEKAKREHKPIFLSIGYSTCHWCHVMAHESFEDPKIAELINRWFVPIKVDREEMPHLDKYYQKVYTLLHHRSGGWPLTILLTEELQPFFAGTYIPPTDSYGVKGLETLLPMMGELYRNHREKIEQRAQAIQALMQKMESLPTQPLELNLTIANQAVTAMRSYYDEVYKGFGDRPKFPESSRLRLLLDIYRLNGHPIAKKMVLETLDAMALSGLYDQIDGAFFRYCVDRRWHIPHFEKMLYTNAELIPIYLQAWKMTGKGEYQRVVRETIAEIDHRFRTPEGLYFSASDADSDHQEGGYFIYRYDEALQALIDAKIDEASAKEILAFLDISEDGNFDTEFAHPRRMGENPPKGFERAKKVLSAMRKSRHYPFIDKKIITAWNGMMIKALFQASILDQRYLTEAEESYRALKHLMEKGDGTLYHQVLFNHQPEQDGLLEDYAFLIDTALTAYQVTLEEHYLKDANRWMQMALKRFYRKGRWLLGSDGFESYADLQDNYYTSPLSVMVNNLIDLALLESSLTYEAVAKETLDAHAEWINKHPDAYPEALRAFLRLKRGVVGIKSNRQALQANREKIDKIRYPFVLKKAEPMKQFIACDMRTCFAFGKELTPVIEAIEAHE